MAAKTNLGTLENIASVRITYYTPELPPPFSYTYSVAIKYTKKGLDFDFELTYTDREELEEEEIFAEGFTLEDDYKSKGTLPETWSNALKTQIQKTSWVNNKKKSSLDIAIVDKEDKVFEGSPGDIASWEYFLQELMQGIFEVGKRELPLEMQYKEVSNKTVDLTITLQASFAERTAHITYNNENEPAQKRPLPWKELKQLLKPVFIPDYLPEKATEEVPLKKGKYINPGDGKWYEFGKAILNLSAKMDHLSILENQLKQACT